MLSLVIASASANASLNLGALLDGQEGVQAIAGLTGAGLPPLDVQWSEGAGDGATYRGKRVLPRDVDVPLYISRKTRAGLRDTVKTLARILADECTLTFTDDVSGAWSLNVVRVGGGDFIYGTDTDGEHDLGVVVTLRAGQPFWTAVNPVETSKTDFSNTALAVDNTGSAPTPPIWEVTGPGKNLSITSPSGEQLMWEGTLTNGEKLFIDSANGTVRNAAGQSQYAMLGPSPRFTRLPAGQLSTWAVEFPNADPGIVRTNLCTNPDGLVDTTGWTANGVCTISKRSAGGFSLLPRAANDRPEYQRDTQALFNGFPVNAGAGYSASFEIGNQTALYYLFVGIQFFTSGGTYISTASANYSIQGPYVPRFSVTGTAPAGAGQAQLSIRGLHRSDANPQPWNIQNVLIEKSLSVTPFFDGSTPDTATNVYSWTGTAGLSTSTLGVTPDRATSKVTCRFYPREWMVI